MFPNLAVEMPTDDDLMTTLLTLFKYGKDFWRMSLGVIGFDDWFATLNPYFFPLDAWSKLFQQR